MNNSVTYNRWKDKDHGVVSAGVLGKNDSDGFQSSPSVKLYKESTQGSGFQDSDRDDLTGQVVKNGFMQAHIAVSGVKAKELRVIQVVYVKPKDGKKFGKPFTHKNGKNYEGFVDGSRCSPNASRPGFELGDKTRPYLYGPSMRDEQAKYGSWNGHEGTILISDEPLAALSHAEIYFETYLVASQYNGKYNDRVLATYSWGFKKGGQTPIHGKKIPLRVTNSLSMAAKTIIKNCGYDDYKTI